MAAYSFGPVLKLCDDGKYKGIKNNNKNIQKSRKIPSPRALNLSPEEYYKQ